jgi:hypothetical protein
MYLNFFFKHDFAETLLVLGIDFEEYGNEALESSALSP